MHTVKDFTSKNKTVGIVGLGYVGLPLAVMLDRKFKVVGFDINSKRIKELNKNIDLTNEVTTEDLKSTDVEYSDDPKSLKTCDLIFVAVPTPVNSDNTPDLRPVLSASKTVAENLKDGCVIVYESTVFPGLTEDYCIPEIEDVSGKKWMKDFFIGYSPERVNPGDKKHTIDKIAKVVSGDTPETGKFVQDLYKEVIDAEVFLASSIKVAEASKVIENTQRDLNIALINELAKIFNEIGIDTREVLEAAGTKWNFLKFEPGLVGGHCIGVDPYYLTQKAQSLGYHPEIILAGRRLNDGMGKYVAENAVKSMIDLGKVIKNAKVAILGFTFKENVPDIRNTRVTDIHEALLEYGVDVVIVDPEADPKEVKEEYELDIVNEIPNDKYDGFILAVKHEEYMKNLSKEYFSKMINESAAIIDVKGLLDYPEFEGCEEFIYWRL